MDHKTIEVPETQAPPTFAAFEANIGTDLQLATDDGPRSIRLVEADSYDVARDRWESFALVFECETVLEQGTYAVNHPVLGQLDLFLVPVTNPGPVCVYEALFNRPVISPAQSNEER